MLEVEKDNFYTALKQAYRQTKNRGPNYLMGDYNARVQKAVSTRERATIGPHTFDKANANPMNQSDEVLENNGFLRGVSPASCEYIL